MTKIQLERGEWTFDPANPLGPAGGFGEVFRGEGAGREVAVKRLKLSAGEAAHREMKIGANLADRTYSHVVPILDFGRDAGSDHYFLVMPVCDYSLQDSLNATGKLPIAEAKAAALDIIRGLIEVRDLVHRDLKPGNILWHEGTWKIADFGIAKFVEDATSLQSLRTSLTPLYAAPEQWRGERPTNATDVYALGCIIYAMLSGAPPFVGNADDIREAHLHAAPPRAAGEDHRLAGLVATMLRKSPESRPSLERCATVIADVQMAAAASSGRAALAAVGQVISQAEAAAEAARTEREAAERERQALVREATAELRAIIDRLFTTIEADTHTARRTPDAIILGPAHLTFGSRGGGTLGPQNDRYKIGWEVAASATLKLRADRGRSSSYDPGYYEFSASLVFAKLPGEGEFRWRELSFHEMWGNRPMYDQPFSLDPLNEHFQIAISRVMGTHQVAHGPWPIDAEDEEAFQERWLKLFAKAAAGQLSSPGQLPLPPSFFA